MKDTRRNFLKKSALLSASLLVPDFLRAFGSLANPTQFNGKRLVIIQLSGGNDGLNCVVPYRNDIYHKLRPGIGLTEKQLVNLTDEVALNIDLTELADLYNAGSLSIINNVGYPNPNRSHFRSTDIWQSASDENQYWNTGWVGRYLDSMCTDACAKPHTAIELDDTLSLALRGEKTKGLAFHDPKVLYLSAQNEIIQKIAQSPFEDDHESVADFLHKSLRDTTQSADYIYAQSKIYKSQVTYPVSDFARRMKSIAELICSGAETQVYYLSLPGFDTHAAQLGMHSRVLKTYSQTIKAFCEDLKKNNLFDDTVIMTFSEFGRRVKQNASKGTDHGTANNVYIINGKLNKPGIYNEMPNLTDLDEGDLKYNIDFRQVYATILQKSLNKSESSILGRDFQTLDFL
jgi:uncharacterized protein (DUF1501 family)